jgi:hypothetical protein
LRGPEASRHDADARFISGAVITCDGGGAIDSVKVALERAGSRMLAAG